MPKIEFSGPPDALLAPAVPGVGTSVRHETLQGCRMTVELFVGKDPQGRIWEPDFTHEANAAIRIIGSAWRAFHASRELYLSPSIFIPRTSIYW
jgi:hypothetical protein